jgi:hypothetical protein
MAPIVALTLSLLALSRSSSATPLQAQRPCVDFGIPVTLATINSDWDAPRVSSTAEAVNFVLNSEAWNKPNLTSKGDIHVNQTFTISARLCVPDNGTKSDILQIATHGGGFSKT